MKINEKPVDLAGALPLRVGDWRALKAAGVTFDALRTLSETQDLDVMVGFVTHVARKSNPAIGEEDVDQLTVQELSEAVTEILQRIMNATIERHDPYRKGRELRVATLAVNIAQRLELPKKQTETLRIAALLLDIGMIELPATIINQPSLLLDPERRLIETHPKCGWVMLEGIPFEGGVSEIVLQHHEHFDGSGYPQGLKGDEIRLEARIVMMADAVEAMCSHRSYREKFSMKKVEQDLMNHRGGRYDPEVADACLAVLRNGEFICS